MSEAQQTITLLINNLNHASDLISSIKQDAVNQTSEVIREINVSEYLSKGVQSLAPNFKKTHHTIDVHCPDDLTIKYTPGVSAQILTNMLMHSLTYGFEYKPKGAIKLRISEQDADLIINYFDNGYGLDEENLKQHTMYFLQHA